MLFIKYLISLYPNDIKIISIDIITLYKNSSNEVIFINKLNKLTPPINEPIISLCILVFRLSMYDTEKRSKKSKKKLIIITISKYIFITITN